MHLTWSGVCSNMIFFILCTQLLVNMLRHSIVAMTSRFFSLSMRWPPDVTVTPCLPSGLILPGSSERGRMAFPHYSHSGGPASPNTPSTRTSWTDTLSALRSPPSCPAWSICPVCREYSFSPERHRYTLKMESGEKEVEEWASGAYKTDSGLWLRKLDKRGVWRKKEALNGCTLPTKRLPFPACPARFKCNKGSEAED